MTVDELRRIASHLPRESAAALKRALDEVAAGKRDLATINVGIHYRLEKFDGDFRPGIAPAEVIEGKG
jgi:hypothetical protein